MQMRDEIVIKRAIEYFIKTADENAEMIHVTKTKSTDIFTVQIPRNNNNKWIALYTNTFVTGVARFSCGTRDTYVSCDEATPTDLFNTIYNIVGRELYEKFLTLLLIKFDLPVAKYRKDCASEK